MVDGVRFEIPRPAQRQPSRRISVVVRTEVREGESIEAAIRRFRWLVRKTRWKPLHKRMMESEAKQSVKRRIKERRRQTAQRIYQMQQNPNYHKSH